jgi:hypothetical protein
MRTPVRSLLVFGDCGDGLRHDAQTRRGGRRRERVGQCLSRALEARGHPRRRRTCEQKLAARRRAISVSTAASTPRPLPGANRILIHIGNHCTITSGVRFVTHDGRAGSSARRTRTSGLRPDRVEDNCFVGVSGHSPQCPHRTERDRGGRGRRDQKRRAGHGRRRRSRTCLDGRTSAGASSPARETCAFRRIWTSGDDSS